MNKVLRELLGYFYPIIIILLLLLFKYINFTQLVVGYLIYCSFVYFTTKTYLFYIKTQFNIDLLENCPSIKKPNFKQYFLLPFTFCQFLLLEASSNPKKINDNEILFREEKIDNEGTSIFWAFYENSKDIHSNPVLFILPGITGQYDDSYVQNIIAEGLNNNFDVVVFQMRTLSSEMKMPKNKFVDFYEDINNSLIKVRNKNKNYIYGVGYSYGANLLTGYMGNINLETNYIEGGVAVSNPFDLYMSQRLGEDTLFESLITYFERKNYMRAVSSFNRKIKNKKKCINVDTLLSSYYVKNFDTEFFGKILGYKNGDEYYRGISSAKYIKNIKICHFRITPCTINYDYFQKKKQIKTICFFQHGAGNGAQTRDLRLGKATLYQLSYSRRNTINIQYCSLIVNSFFNFFLPNYFI